MTIREAIAEGEAALAAVGVETPRLDAELLLAQVLGRARRWLWTYPEQDVSLAGVTAYRALLARRVRREPLAYILGEWEFYGRPFFVSRAVLIPRPETELLVEAVVAWVKRHGAQRIVDVGAGSGAIAVTLALELPLAAITAIDLCAEALAMAQRNAERHGVAEHLHWVQGDLLQPLAAADRGAVDVIVANLPYIAREEIPALMPEVRDFEPRLALLAKDGGLALIYRLIDSSPPLLRPGGLLALELGQGQAGRVRDYLAKRHWRAIQVIEDYAGIPRHVLAIK